MAKLTDKQKMFCKEYMVDLNATQAAIRADYSESTSKQIGSENLSKLAIQEEIQRLMSKRAQRVEINAEDVLQDIIDTREQCGALMVLDGEIDSAAVNARLKANDMLAKHLGMYIERVEHSGSVDISATTKMIEKYLKGD